MSKPIVRKIMGGSLKFCAPGDVYVFDGKEQRYEKTKAVFAIAGVKGAVEIPKDVFEAITKFLADPDVKLKMRDWV
jgi:hypothetical protein